MGKGTTKKTKESAVQKKSTAEKLDIANLPEIIFDNDRGCIVAKFDDGREPVTVALNGAQFAAAVLKISNEISCCESKAQEKALYEELEKKARACREELKGHLEDTLKGFLKKQLNGVINSLKKKEEKASYPLRYRAGNLCSFLRNNKNKVADPATELGKRLKELHDFLEKNKNRIESHYNMEELGKELSRLYKLPVDQNRTWLNKFKECKYFKENKKNENQDYGRVVSNLLSEARETIDTELQKNGINLSVKMFLPEGSKRMKYPREKIQFQGHDPFFEVAKGVLAIKGSSEIILSDDGTEIKFISEDIEGVLEIPKGIKNIRREVFGIRREVFGNYIKITNIRIPESVISVDEGRKERGVLAHIACALSRCSKLECIEVAKENLVYKSINGMLFNKEGTKLICVPRGMKGALQIPKGILEIGEYAFKGCIGLTDITIPKGVTKIGKGAFWGCRELTSITIPKGVTKIGSNAFEDCRGLISVTIPEEVDEIEFGVFSGCRELKSITIPKSVWRIGKQVFWGCRELKHVELEEGNPSYKIMNGMLLDKQETEIIFVSKEIKVSLQIPASIGEVREYAFNGCTGMPNITIPENVTKIGDCAFRGCIGLTSITIPKGITRISWYAFQDCVGLKRVTISENVDEIGWYAFSGCTSLKEIYFEGDAPKVEENSFENVHATVYYRKGTKGWWKTFGGLPTKEIGAKDIKKERQSHN